MRRIYDHLIGLMLFLIALIVLVVLIGVSIKSNGVYALCFLVGSIGSIINNYYRLRNIFEDNPITEKILPQQIPDIIKQIYLSALVAGVFGCLMIVFLMAGMLEGNLFPKFSILSEKFESLQMFLSTVVPNKNEDFAKCIAWAFIAGFGEKLVPNIIDKVSNQINLRSLMIVEKYYPG